MRPVVIDNVISLGYQEYVENIFGMNFSWFFTPRVSDDVSEDSNTGFSHPIFEDKTFSKHYDALLPIFFEALDKKERGLKPEKLIRIRAGMFIQNQNKHPHLPHIDFPYKHTTMLYYVNDSDGPTTFYEKSEKSFKKIKQVTPKKGRFVLFDGNTYHSSTPPQKNHCRCVININVLP